MFRRIGAVALLLLIGISSNAAAQDGASGAGDGESLPFTDSGAGVADIGGFDSYVRFSHLMGDAIGHTSNYTMLGAFTPIFQSYDQLAFVDAQMIVTNRSRLAANVGLGSRFYVEEWDRMFGVSGWYDVDDGRGVALHQAGFSLETYGPLGDLRINIDLPFNTTTRTRFSSLSNTRFVGNNIVSDRQVFQTTPLNHFEVMVGGAIPHFQWSDDPSLRGYVGYYHLDGTDSRSANGVLGRLEGFTVPDLSFHVTVRNDPINRTSALLGLTWVLPGGSPSRGSTTYEPSRRLALPVARDYRVAVAHEQTTETVASISSLTSNPFSVAHVDSAAAAGGMGTVESPFSSFTELAASGGTFDIILVAADSSFDNQPVTLADNQRLLCSHRCRR